MITAPLQLEARLRKPPRNFDALFYVNVGALGLMFVLFGSRFVLLPGVNVALPQLAEHKWMEPADGRRVLIQQDGQIVFDGAFHTPASFRAELRRLAAEKGRIALIIQADQQVPYQRVFELSAEALELGLPVSWAAENSAGLEAGGGATTP